MNYLANNIRFLRQKRKLTQAEIEAECGLKENVLSNYENARSRPNVDILIKLSNVLRVSIDDLLLFDFENSSLSEMESRLKTGNEESSLHTSKESAFNTEDELSLVKEDDSVPMWAVYGRLTHIDLQLRELNKKVDRLRDSGQEE